jgi:hypothetical protein
MRRPTRRLAAPGGRRPRAARTTAVRTLARDALDADPRVKTTLQHLDGSIWLTRVNPQPPIYGLSDASRTAAELYYGLGALAALAYCIYLARKERKIWPLMVWASGAPMTAWEPMQNIVTHVRYPVLNQHVAFEIYGLKMPVYLVLLYVFFFGFMVPWIMRKIRAGVSRVYLMKVYAACVIFAASFEPIPVHVLDWYRYYGPNQPLMFFSVPAWWFFVNAMVIVGISIIFVWFQQHVFTADWQSVLFIPLGLLVCGGLHHSAGIPVYTAIGSNWSLAATTVAALLSSGIAVAYVWWLTKLVAVPEGATTDAVASGTEALAGV